MATIELVPLESNPDVMNRYLRKFGVPPNWDIVDVLQLEGTELCLVPRPVLAVLLLFPVTAAYEKLRKKEEQTEKDLRYLRCPDIPRNVFFIKQHPINAGGTIALMHSIANNTESIKLTEWGTFNKYLKEAKGLDAEGRATLLEEKYGAIFYAHSQAAVQGQSFIPSAAVPAAHHFVAFVHVDGVLYELDGRRVTPINHGPTGPDCVLEDTITVVKGYIARHPKEVKFTLLALAPFKDRTKDKVKFKDKDQEEEEEY